MKNPPEVFRGIFYCYGNLRLRRGRSPVSVRFQYGAKHIDTMDNKQLSYDNLIIMYSEKDSYYGTQYLQFDLWSDGDGYYITKGKAIPIRWIKDTEWGPMRFEDKDGNQITMNQGKTFISVVPTENEKDTIIGKDKNSNEIN